MYTSASDADRKKSIMLWSPEQSAVFSFCANGKGHGLVEALAGTGKTTTLVEALDHFKSSKTKLVVAFNKEIASEMDRRVTKAGVAKTEVSTLHSYGLRQLSSHFRGQARLEIDRDKVHNAAREIFPRFDQRKLRDALKKVVSVVKNNNLPLNEEVIETIVFDLDLLEGWEQVKEMVEGSTRLMPEVFTEACLNTLRWCADPIRTGSIDFDDMIWLPVHLDVACWRFDVVLVDETQDLNATQLELVQRACKPTGRILACGDRHQSIYQFRGADADAIPNMIEGLSATVLTLTTTYRCPRAVVREANKYVPALRAASDAKEGRVRTIGEDEMVREVGPNDFIISRTNAPLVKHCLAFFAQGRRAMIQGRDIGKALIDLIESSKRTSVPDFIEWVNRWEARKIEKAIRKDPDTDVGPIADKAECLRAIAKGASSIEEMQGRANALFSDDKNATAIVLTTVHKAKGLERPRVFMLESTFRPWSGVEESNLAYVAITRAQDELVYVRPSE